MTTKVSIIVPVYNAGKYFYQCLDSLIHQTLSEIEIILILDCPTDGSDRIAKEYSLKDNRIKLIYNKQNLNTGLSRNEGLKIAQGEYIGFSDHDDWRELNMYEVLYRKAKENSSDVVISNYDSVYPNKTTVSPYPLKEPIDEIQKKKIFSHFIGEWNKTKTWKPFTRNGSMWQMLYKKELIEKHNILFLDNNKATFEDLFFLIQTFYFASKVTYIPKVFYHHMYHQTNQFNNYLYYSTPRVINYLEHLNQFLVSKQIRNQYILDYFSSTLYYLWRSLKNEIKHKSYFSAFHRLIEIRKNTTIKTLLKQVPFSVKMARKLKVQKTILWILLKL